MIIFSIHNGTATQTKLKHSSNWVFNQDNPKFPVASSLSWKFYALVNWFPSLNWSYLAKLSLNWLRLYRGKCKNKMNDNLYTNSTMEILLGIFLIDLCKFVPGAFVSIIPQFL